MPVIQKMSPKIGLNVRVTGNCNQGDRKYMEDVFTVAYQQSADGSDLEYAFFGMFDGHGGKEAAVFAKENLLDNIVALPDFWSDNDEDVLKAIKDGFIITHKAMFKELDNWPRTASGLPSTSGTTASVAFIRQAKLYIGHVGDSGIVIGERVPDRNIWKATPLTQDHKPESAMEIARIQQCGGKVLWKAGVPRVVWNRPRIGHKGPVRRSTPIDEIPFLAVARSLGDLWSYNSAQDAFVVSPEPDVHVIDLDVTKHRCLIFGTDGLWNVVTPLQAVWSVQEADTFNERHLLNSPPESEEPSDTKAPWVNPSKQLVDRALDAWFGRGLRADNCSVVTVLLDPPGPPRSYVLWMQKQQKLQAEAVRHLPLQPDFLQAGTSAAEEDYVPNLKKLEMLTKETIGNQEYPSTAMCGLYNERTTASSTHATPYLSAALGFGPPVTPNSSSTAALEADRNARQLRERNKHEKEDEIAKKSASGESCLVAKKTPSCSGLSSLLELKRPRTRSCSGDQATELERNVSDAENEQAPSCHKRTRTMSTNILSRSLRNNASQSTLKEPKVGKKVLEVATVFQGRILRSSHTPIVSLVRSLRSHTQGSSNSTTTPSTAITPKNKKCEKSKSRTPSWQAQHSRRRSRYSKIK